MRKINVRDSIGQRGESIFYVIITRLYDRNFPLFQPQFLGDKWPIADFIVELANYSGDMIPYCFVQVKTTRKGYTQTENRLRVKISKDNTNRLASYPAPTYLVGIDEIQETGYIVSASTEHHTDLTSLSTQFPLNKETQDLLWQEVIDFWTRIDISHKVSMFADPEWR